MDLPFKEFKFYINNKLQFCGILKIIKCDHLNCKEIISIGLPYCANHLKENLHLIIKETNKGKGVFSINKDNEDDEEIVFKKDTVITTYNGESLNINDVNNRYGVGNTAPYVLKSHLKTNKFEAHYIDSSLIRGIGSLINCSNKKKEINVKLETTGDICLFIAIKNIYNNEELLYDYGNTYVINQKGITFETIDTNKTNIVSSYINNARKEYLFLSSIEKGEIQNIHFNDLKKINTINTINKNSIKENNTKHNINVNYDNNYKNSTDNITNKCFSNVNIININNFNANSNENNVNNDNYSDNYDRKKEKENNDKRKRRYDNECKESDGDKDNNIYDENFDYNYNEESNKNNVNNNYSDSYIKQKEKDNTDKQKHHYNNEYEDSNEDEDYNNWGDNFDYNEQIICKISSSTSSSILIQECSSSNHKTENIKKKKIKKKSNTLHNYYINVNKTNDTNTEKSSTKNDIDVIDLTSNINENETNDNNNDTTLNKNEIQCIDLTSNYQTIINNTNDNDIIYILSDSD